MCQTDPCAYLCTHPSVSLAAVSADAVTTASVGKRRAPSRAGGSASPPWAGASWPSPDLLQAPLTRCQRPSRWGEVLACCVDIADGPLATPSSCAATTFRKPPCSAPPTHSTSRAAPVFGGVRARAFVQSAPDSGWFAREEAIMGTAIRVELWCDSRREAEAAMAAVMAEMHRIDRAMSPHKPASELSRINQRAARAPVALSEEMFLPGRTRVPLFTTFGRRLRHQLRRGRPALRLPPRHLPQRGRHRPGAPGGGLAAPDARRACAQPALRTPRHAHRPGRLRQGPRGGQRRPAAGAARHPPRHRLGRRRQPRHRRPPRPALDRGHPPPAACRPRWWRCCRWWMCRSPPRATTSAISTVTACASIT